MKLKKFNCGRNIWKIPDILMLYLIYKRFIRVEFLVRTNGNASKLKYLKINI